MEAKLIDLVREKPYLFDKSCRDFKNQKKKYEAWMEIASELGISEKACQVRWKSLRERYSKVKRESKGKSGQGFIQSSSWEDFNSLSFLEDHVRARRTISNFDIFYPSSTLPLPSPLPSTLTSPLPSPTLSTNSDLISPVPSTSSPSSSASTWNIPTHSPVPSTSYSSYFALTSTLPTPPPVPSTSSPSSISSSSPAIVKKKLHEEYFTLLKHINDNWAARREKTEDEAFGELVVDMLSRKPTETNSRMKKEILNVLFSE